MKESVVLLTNIIIILIIMPLLQTLLLILKLINQSKHLINLLDVTLCIDGVYDNLVLPDELG